MAWASVWVWPNRSESRDHRPAPGEFPAKTASAGAGRANASLFLVIHRGADGVVSRFEMEEAASCAGSRENPSV